MTTDMKYWWQSTTIIAAMASILGKLLGVVLNVTIPDDTIADLSSLLAVTGSIVADFIAIKGRKDATTKIV